MDILLLQPLGGLDEPSGYMRTCLIEPLTLECLAAAAEAEGHTAQVLTDNVTDVEIGGAVRSFRPDILCISVYTYQFDHSLYLARVAKQVARELGYNLVTVFGGYHPSACPEETARCDEVDFVVVGEGERTLCELAATVTRGDVPFRVPGLVFRHEDDLIRTPPRERQRKLDALPLPKRYPTYLNRSHQYQITYPAPSEQISVAQVSYSRGCPYSCSFCSSESTWGRSVVWRSPVAVLDEIEMLHERYGTNLVYFPDLTFNANREKVFAICEAFIARRLPVHWWGLFRLDRLDEEMLLALVEAGCVKLSLGIESPENAVTESVKGRYESSTDERERLLRKADALGLVLKAFIMIGLPEDTHASLTNYTAQLLGLPLDEIRVTFATPFPGTAFFESAVRDGLISRNPDWSTFTTESPVLNHPTLRRDELLLLREQIVMGFYTSSEYAAHAADKVGRFPRLALSWIEYFEFIQERGLFRGQEEKLGPLMEGLRSVRATERGATVERRAETASQLVDP